MGDIVELKDVLNERQRKASPIRTATAEILFFTGVRYQKFVDVAEMTGWVDPKDGASAGNSRRKRKA